jgi:hypothetical protein
VRQFKPGGSLEANAWTNDLNNLGAHFDDILPTGTTWSDDVAGEVADRILAVRPDLANSPGLLAQHMVAVGVNSGAL